MQATLKSHDDSSGEDALQLMSSSTISDRNRGIQQFSDLLSNPANMASLKESKWMATFHQLFTSAEIEKTALVKQLASGKSAASQAGSLKRLKAVAGLIQNCTSQFAPAFKQKVLKLVMHRSFELVLSANRSLMDAVAWDCIRIFRDLLLYRPHLEHLQPKTCAELLAICFAAILDKKLPRALTLTKDVDYVDDGIPLAAPDSVTASAAVNPRILDSARLLSLILSSPSSLCLEHSKSLLRHLHKVLIRFPRETSAHLDFLSALQTVLRELELNKGHDLARYSVELADCLVALWPTKTSDLKEQIILCLTYLFPFVIRDVESSQAGAGDGRCMDGEQLVKKVFEVISNDKEQRAGMDLISLGALNLSLPSTAAYRSVLSTKALCRAAGDGSNLVAERNQVMTWGALVLGANALKSIAHLADRFVPREHRSPRKRRKVDDELELFFQRLKPGRPTPSVVHRLQLLIVATDLHWRSLNPSTRSQIVDAAMKLLHSDDSEVLNWVFVFMGNLAHCQATLLCASKKSNSVDQTSPSNADWERLWSYAIRRTAHPPCCRSASYVALCILITHRIPVQTAHDGIYGFLRDLYVQGPAFPYDSVCMLVSECLAFASDNMRLSAHSLEDKALIWLSKIWPEVDRAAATTRDLGGNSQRSRRPIPEGFDSEAFARLLLSIAKLRQFPRLTPTLIVPDCAATEAFNYLESTKGIRSSNFNHLSQDAFDPSHVSFLATATCRPLDQYHSSSSALVDPYSTTNPGKQISSLLRQSIEKLIDETGRTDKSSSIYLSIAKCAHVKMAISILVAALLYEASCEGSGSTHDRENIDILATFLGIVTHLVEAPEWTPPERAILFACFGPIVLPSLNTLNKSPCRGIASPGRASGLSFKQRAALGPDVSANKTELEYEALVSKIWSLNSAVNCQLENFLIVCERLLRSLSSSTSSNVPGTAVDANTQATGRWNVFDDDDEDVEMNDIRNSREGSTFSNLGGPKKKALRTGLGAAGHARATLAVTDVCIRVLVTAAKISTSSDKEHLRTHSRIVSILEDCRGSEITFVGFPLFDCLAARLMTMTANQVNRILEHLGDTYLTTYAHSQNVEIRRLTLKMLQISIPYWNNVDIEGAEDVGSTARVLCRYMASQMLTGNTRSWEVHHEFNILLDSYLESDPLQASWTSNMSSTAPQGAEEDSGLPVDLMLQSLQDGDHRVRHGGTFFVPRVFELTHSSQHDPVHHWNQVLKHLPPSSSELEIMLTRSLCIVNTLVLSEEIRPRAYHRLLNILMQPLETQEDILHHDLAHQLLQRAALQLGFADIGKLYQLYAAHVAVERQHMEEPALHVSEKFIGKRLVDPQKTQAARDHLLATGAHFYYSDPQAFQTSTRLAGLKEDEALRLCSPHIIAELLSRACFQTSSEDASIDIDSQVQSKLKKINASTGFEDILNFECDRITVHLLSSAYIKPQDLDLFIKVFMEDTRNRNVFEVLISRLRKCRVCEPALPFYPIWCLAKAMKWVGQRYPIFTEPALAYSIICHTLASFLRSPFINDRIRTLYSLSIYISLSHTIIANSLPILSLLLQGSLPLISDDNVFQPVCTLDKWVLSKILQPSNSHLKGYPLISSYVISTVEAVKRVADSPTASEPDVSVAQDFHTWLLDHVVKTRTSGSKDYQNLCHSLLLHWPEKLPILSQIWDNDATLVNHCLASPSSFKLIHHLSDHCLPENSVEAGTILYNLLVSARQMKSELRTEDCKAFLKLLYRNSGILTAPRLGQAVPSDSESYLERTHPLASENEIISRIFAIAVSRLQTLDFQLMLFLTEFIQRASNFELRPDFTDQFCRVPELLAGRAELISHPSLCRAYDTHRFSKPSYLSDFSSLDSLACSSNRWTPALLQLLIASRAETRPFYAQLAPLIEIDGELASNVLQPVLHACLLNEVEARKTSLKQQLSKHFLNILQSPSTDKVVITRVLDLVVYLRSQQRPGSDPLGHDNWLEVDWIELAKHATRSGMSASGFLFIEVAREHGCLDNFPMTADGGVQSVIEQLYTTAPEPDAFYSLLPKDPRSSLLQRYQHESQWEFAFALHGAILEGSDIKSSAFSEGIPSIARYLSSYGLNKLAHSVLQTHSLSTDHHDLGADGAEAQSTLPFELAWRASTWDLPVTDRLDTEASTRLYGALQSYNREREESRRTEVVETCLLGQFKELARTTVGRAQPSSKIIGSALALTDIASWSSSERGKPLKSDALESLLCLPSGCDYDMIERISAVRRSLLEPVMNQQLPVTMGEELKHTIRVAQETDLQIRIRTSQEARLSGHLQSALNVITPFADSRVDTGSLVVLRAREEFAEVLWAKGEQSLALNTLKVVQASQKSLPESAVQLSRLGEWIAAARLQSPTDIVNLYFEKAIQLLDSTKHPEAFGRVCFIFAKFTDKQYRELLESRQLTSLAESTQRLEAEVQATQNPTDVEERKAAKWKERIYQEDKEKLDSLSQLQARYLSSALKMYLNSLTYEDQHDDVVFRFVSLWFEQHSDNKMNKELRGPVSAVPTFKFVRVAHQLSARLSQDPQSEFQLLLGQLVTRLCGDHPFHTMFQILLLQRGIKSSVTDVTDSPLRARSRRVSQKNPQPDQLTVCESSRAKAADSVLLAIHRMEKRREILQELLVTHKAYNEWAMCKVDKNPEFQRTGRSAMELPSHYLLAGLKDLSIPISTASLPIDKTCRYLPENLVCINGYDGKFTLAGGLHRPKIMDCRGSDGRVYRQLFKGGDDVRQDAVMEQVFELVNGVLKRDPECRKRRLNFRTYCVVPLSPLAGVIEFVTNTLSLLQVLAPMHKKYNEPPDWSWNRIQSRIKSAEDASVQERIKNYKEVRAHVRPAMRFWFMENQKCPQDWYEMRLNYTRTTATASIVGYILGLGDRHLSNILLDEVSGEMVQIDLGIAFDGGKQLRIPETVPFRLTPDIVDGFGITKTDGVFRRCCELTLRVLRANKSLIMTIIDVLKHDPLHAWVITEKKAKQMQGNEYPDFDHPNKQGAQDGPEPQVSENASRALASVENKLGADLSIETTVNILILEATNLDNLGSIFIGWSPFY